MLDAAMTPSSSRGGSKRKTVPKLNAEGAVLSASTASSSTASHEKVTPDPKHIRTGDEGLPQPKQLFASPAPVQEEMHEGRSYGQCVCLLPSQPADVFSFQCGHVGCLVSGEPKTAYVRGLSSMTTIPATEEELERARET